MTKNKKRRLNKRRRIYKYRDTARDSWSVGSRLYSATRAKEAADAEIEEYMALSSKG